MSLSADTPASRKPRRTEPPESPGPNLRLPAVTGLGPNLMAPGRWKGHQKHHVRAGGAFDVMPLPALPKAPAQSSDAASRRREHRPAPARQMQTGPKNKGRGNMRGRPPPRMAGKDTQTAAEDPICYYTLAACPNAPRWGGSGRPACVRRAWMPEAHSMRQHAAWRSGGGGGAQEGRAAADATPREAPSDDGPEQSQGLPSDSVRVDAPPQARAPCVGRLRRVSGTRPASATMPSTSETATQRR